MPRKKFAGIVRGMKNTAANQIVKALTPAAIRARIGVSVSSIEKAQHGIPARWYVVIRNMCIERGIDCPYEAFNFKEEVRDHDAA